MTFLDRLYNEIYEAKITQKELKSKFKNFSPFYKDLYIFSEPLSNNKSHHNRRNAGWGLYDIKTNQIVLPAKYKILTFGSEKKTVPNFIDGGESFQNHKLIKTHELGDEIEDDGYKYKETKNQNYYDLDSRSFIFPDKYEEIDSIKKNSSSIIPLFETKRNKKIYIIDKNANELYSYNKEWAGDIEIIEYNKNLYSITTRYDWADSTSLTNITQKKRIINFGEFNSIKTEKNWMVSFNGLWLTAKKESDYTLVNIETGQRKEIGNVSKILSTSKGIYVYNQKYGEGVELFNVFSNEKYNLPNPYDEIEEIKNWFGTIFMFAKGFFNGNFFKSIFSYKNNKPLLIVDKLDWGFKMPETGFDMIIWIFENFSQEK